MSPADWTSTPVTMPHLGRMARLFAVATMIVGPALIFPAPGETGPLLEPTGTWAVGRASLEVVDASRTMRGSKRQRRLVLRIWYPASRGPAAESLPYVEGLDGARDLLGSDEASLLKTVRTHATAAPPAAPPPSRFPELLFSHGDQTAAFLYSQLHEELASHGYVVVAVEHPGLALFVTFADGSLVPYSEDGRPPADSPQYGAALSRYLRGQLAERTADLRTVHARLKGLEIAGRKLGDLLSGQAGVFGHSSGGLAAALLCQQPPLLDACLNMDGRLDAAPFAVEAGIQAPSHPFMYLTKPFRALSDSELKVAGLTREQSSGSQAAAWERDGRLMATAGPPSYRVTLHGAQHESFSDEPQLRGAESGSVEMMRNVRGLVVEFFDATLRGAGKVSMEPRRNAALELEVLAPPPLR